MNVQLTINQSTKNKEVALTIVVVVLTFMEACQIAVRKLCSRRVVVPFAAPTLICSTSPYSNLSSSSARGFSSYDAADRGLFLRRISQLVSPSKGSKKVMFVDTLALVRRLESQGLTPKQAEAVTAAIIEVLNDSMDNVSQTFVSKPDMQKNEMMQEAALQKITADIQNAQEYKISLTQREVERIRTDVEKMRSDLRYEIDKVTAAQRLDINLERGRTRDDLAKQSVETSELTNKLDREIHTLKTQVEAAKYEVIKYGIGTIVSLTAVGLGLLRILM
ncbi:hypothetical protein GOP47_0009711 [Adiantum capillus-veneris]|uniref:Uncharacterized protein n=1 Tax=Adiantum capillus-veneris TaxID=13818 RepID=A0A9D4UXI4_ADICA|nr:hypothetical protein GOP47_0009711 [Adiantum capillus-veneris]